MFKRWLGEYKKEIDERLEEFFEEKKEELGEIDSEVGKLVGQLEEIGLKGKRLRGFLFLVGCGIGQGWERLEFERIPEKIWRGSMGLELFHLGLLVQDDVMDMDEERRGVKTIHKRYEDLHYGEAMANLGGDLCFAWAGELLSELGEEVWRRWSRYFERVVMGQIMDVVQSSKFKGQSHSLKLKTLEKYEIVIKLKTGEYTGEMPLVLGCLAGGGGRKLAERLGGWGLEWGIGFQLRDDLLDGDGMVELIGEARTKKRLEKQVKGAKSKRTELVLGEMGEILKEMEEFLVVDGK